MACTSDVLRTVACFTQVMGDVVIESGALAPRSNPDSAANESRH
jgi:hypothetical protein